MSAPQKKDRSRPVIVLAAVIWLLSVPAASAAVWKFKMTAGDTAAAPEEWPSSIGLTPDAARPTLVMTVHPKCPCSQASVAELARIAMTVTPPIRAYVVFVEPEHASDDWRSTDLWKQVAAISGVTAVHDPGGKRAAVLGARVSGDTVVYGRDGRLVFHGGVTSARGHEGDGPARQRLLAALGADGPSTRSAPVFGCELGELVEAIEDGGGR